MANKYAKALNPTQLPKEVYDVVFAEAAGGDNAELQAVASTVLNRIDKQGLKRGLLGFSSFVKGSPQFRKASRGDLNDYEKQVYEKVVKAVDSSVNNREPWWFFENTKAFGQPPWLEDAKTPGTSIGRQNFFERNDGGSN